MDANLNRHSRERKEEGSFNPVKAPQGKNARMALKSSPRCGDLSQKPKNQKNGLKLHKMSKNSPFFDFLAPCRPKWVKMSQNGSKNMPF
jgi:hypothetical protein